MRLTSTARPFVRLIKRAPGYAPARRRVITRLRTSPRGRRIARSVYRDLVGPDEVEALIEEERQVRAAEHKTERQRLVAEHKAELRSLKAQHKDKLERTKRDAVRAQERVRRQRPAVSAGSLVAGLYLAERPLILFDVRGVDADMAVSVVEEIALEQVLGCGFRPMFLSDLPDPSPWQRYDHLCELVPVAEGWSGTKPFEHFLASRLESIRAAYGVGWVMRIAPAGLTDQQRVFLTRCGR